MSNSDVFLTTEHTPCNWEAFEQQDKTIHQNPIWNYCKKNPAFVPLDQMADDLQLPDELLALSSAVEKFPEASASGNKDIQAVALRATKFIFDFGAFPQNMPAFTVH